MIADLDRKAELFRHVFRPPPSPYADFGGEGMRAAIAALRRVAHREQEAFVAAGERLQAECPGGGQAGAARG
ncbi:MAG: hypothetical protein RML45_14190 [Acetobacteraceae bacterium]|nr:hypothetical protein [Acetobacteraceae bacterium]